MMNLPDTTMLNAQIAHAWQLISEGQITDAMAIASQAYAHAPESAAVCHVLGVIACRDGRPDLALDLLQKALNGGVSEQRLRDMAEALLLLKQPHAALAPIQDALRLYGPSANALGLQAAIYSALEQFDDARRSATQALALQPDSVIWPSTLAFADLIQGHYAAGFKGFTYREPLMQPSGRCPVLHFSQPGELWLKNEQGPGDTLFFLGYAQVMRERGWTLHVQSHIKMLPILEATGLFASVSLAFTCPPHGFWLNIGDLPLAAQQCGLQAPYPPLPLQANASLKEKLHKILAKFGPPPYIAVTWRGGVKGKKIRNGSRMGDRAFEVEVLGKLLAQTQASIISIQRLPDSKEAARFERALGRGMLNLSRLNDDLAQMLALLDLVDGYIGVPNTNHHLRESLGKPSHMLVNRPYEDWRWGADGDSPWYPHTSCYRQAANGDLTVAVQALSNAIHRQLSQHALPHAQADQARAASTAPATPALAVEVEADAEAERLAQVEQLLSDGWHLLKEKQVTQAIRLAQQAQSLHPQHGGVFHLLGWAAMRDMQYPLAVSLLEKAASLLPMDGRVTGDWIRALAVNDDFTQAYAVAAQAIEVPDMQGRSHLFYARAACFLRQNRLQDAIADYDQCLQVNPQRLDAQEYRGMARLTLGQAWAGFRDLTARASAQRPELLNDWCCPLFTNKHRGSRVLIKRDMGLGDELSFLRYMPWLHAAGIEVDYWGGKKLQAVLQRTGLFHRVLADHLAPPDAAAYDLSLIVSETPLASQQLGAPEIAPPLTLSPQPDLVTKWCDWLHSLGPAPYIGITWRAGLGVQGKVNIFDKLAKAVDSQPFAQSLSGLNATFISLQRNVFAEEVAEFSRTLAAPLHDAAALTDDLDDLLALLSLLDEHIGVSNTNMHLRAGLGLGSRVLVQYPSSDWRWGVNGSDSPWFSASTVYRQQADQSWQAALSQLRDDLICRYGQKAVQALPSNHTEQIAHPALSQHLLWVCPHAEKPITDAVCMTSRMLSSLPQLQAQGWQYTRIEAGMAALIGGWNGRCPNAGDVVVFTSHLPAHALPMLKDAQQRGAYAVLLLDAQANQTLPAHIQSMAQLADTLIQDSTRAQPLPSLSGMTAALPALDATAASWTSFWLNLFTQLTHAHTKRNTLAETTTVIATKKANEAHVARPIAQAPEQQGRLLWLTAGTLDHSLGYVSSALASTRYRVLLPAANLGPLGWQSQIISEADLLAHGWQALSLQARDILIVSKSLNPDVMPLLWQARAQGVRIVVDFCDLHFQRADTIGQHQHQLLTLADQIVCSTAPLADHVHRLTTLPVVEITDCVEGIKQTPQFSPKATLHLLWFGSPTNLDTLQTLLPALAEIALHQPLRLELVTVHPQGEATAKAECRPGLEVVYTPWHPTRLQAALSSCDMVLIPTLHNEQKASKSPNRMLEALWAGRYVVAGDLPAYRPFAPFAAVGEDWMTAITWAIQHPQAVLDKIAAAQTYIANTHTPRHIGMLWHDVLSQVQRMGHTAQTPSLSHLQGSGQPLRLNLGCGDKLLQGYVNVDVVESRAGKRPDVLCDLHRLTPFADNSVDEILSVHVIEHFWRWEVLDILKEWVRVLKPGGKMILECPNLQSACEAFLKNPEAAMSEGVEGQRSMWVFYGDPAWKDPYMVHRWGYTPASLGKLMTQAGLINARQASAQFKLREPRDMRVIAEKP